MRTEHPTGQVSQARQWRRSISQFRLENTHSQCPATGIELAESDSVPRPYVEDIAQEEEDMKRLLYTALTAFLAGGFCAFAGSEPQIPEKAAEKPQKRAMTEEDKIMQKALMAKKLHLSQELLKALVLNDFDSAKINAEELIKLRKEAAWMMRIKKDQLENYEVFGKEFTRSAEKIIAASKEKNLDGAKLGYLEMTHTCFNCHAVIRDWREVRHELPPVNRTEN